MPTKKGEDKMPAKGHNGIATTAKPFVEELEDHQATLDRFRGEYMARCKGVREEMKETIKSAKEAGVATRALRALIKRRVLEKKINKIEADSKFDPDEVTMYQQLVDAFGALGEASARGAGFDVTNGKVKGRGRGRAAEAAGADASESEGAPA
jgi:hypothetical protein